MTVKADLRTRCGALRRALSPDARADAAARIAERADRLALARLPAGATVGLYAAVRGEVSTDAIAARAIARGLRLAYPRVDASAPTPTMTFHLASPGALERGPLTIPSPAADAPRVELADLAVLVLPALAYDLRGHRVGSGRGYYDRAIAGINGARPLLVGVAFDCQLVADIPCDDTDIPVNLVLTEAGVIFGPVPGARPPARDR
jgi:5-formyltetrahydrofolate cyclo-ligase